MLLHPRTPLRRPQFIPLNNISFSAFLLLRLYRLNTAPHPVQRVPLLLRNDTVQRIRLLWTRSLRIIPRNQPRHIRRTLRLFLGRQVLRTVLDTGLEYWCDGFHS